MREKQVGGGDVGCGENWGRKERRVCGRDGGKDMGVGETEVRGEKGRVAGRERGCAGKDMGILNT
jgi:hypothetical protein